MHTVVVFSGGPPPGPGLVRAADRALDGTLDAAPDLVVAADGGLHLARAAGRHVDLVVGDLDSADPALVDAAVADGAVVDRHPVDKDATDLELALEAAVASVPPGGTGRVVVVGDPRGRLDHLLAGLAVLSSPRWAGVEVEGLLGGDRVLPVWTRRRFRGRPGATVTLLAAHGTARGVVTDGLEWRLDGADLPAGAGLGVSNQLVRDEASVSVAEGCVVVVLPGDDAEAGR